MTPLDQEATVYLSRAIGWIELGNCQEAAEELDKIGAPMRSHPDVLEARLSVFLKTEKWDACVYLAKVILAPDSSRLSAWIGQSYAKRRIPGGSVQQAFDALLPAERDFPFQYVIPFNLACYATQLGKIDEAEGWFKKDICRVLGADWQRFILGL